MKDHLRLYLLVVLCMCVLFTSCTKAEENNKTKKNDNTNKAVTEIRSSEEFKSSFEGSGDKLLVLDLYADWCHPCKMLAPILEKVASENQDKASFYKINIDSFPKIAAQFNVTGIPYVVFVRNKKVVHSIIGVRTKDAYERVVNEFSKTADQPKADKPDGKLVDGIRVIEIEPGAEPVNIYVYRGETVKLKIGKKGYPFSVHIPQFKVSKEAKKGEGLEITFKAKKIGAFPMFCNGDCPAGDGARHATIIVMRFESSGKTVYREVSAKEAKELIQGKKGFVVLDVRTPKEYYAGHLENARLIPVQQLSQRISEIEELKNKEFLVYCRSGNRSTVASEILKENGFKKLYNMRLGIKSWLQEGYPTVK